MTPEPDRLLTASEIAELAGVTPSAVSNWRKRFVNFPRPAGTAPSGGDLFRLEDVELWLESRGRSSKPEGRRAEQLWSVAERLVGRALAGDVGGLVAIAAAFIHLARGTGDLSSDRLAGNAGDVSQWVQMTVQRIEADRPELAGVFAPLADLDAQALQLLLDSLDDLHTCDQLATAVEEALTRGTRYGDFRTAPAVAECLVELAEPRGAVLDPAVGSGEFLLRAAAASPDSSLHGQELNLDTWRVATARLLLQGVRATLEHGDSFSEDAFPDLRADVVFCEPPFGARVTERQKLAGDARWHLLGRLDRPPSRAAEFAWLAHVIHHLGQDGRGYVLLPTGSLFGGGAEADLRAELLRQGTVEAIATVPSGVLQQTPAPSALWIVRPPTSTPKPVLLIAGDDQSTTASGALDRRIIETVRTWRAAPGEFASTAGFAAAVPVLELLAGDASLAPSRWVYEPDLVDTQALISGVRDARQGLEQVRRDLPPAPPQFDLEPAAEPRPRLRVRDLVNLDLATIVRPSRLKSDHFTDEGLPVWVPGDVRSSWERDEPAKFADPDQVDPQSITQPGDVVLTTVGGLRTRVDTEGGHVLGTSLQALRLDPAAFDPKVVAQLLTSEPNRRLMSGTIPRVKVLELEIPRLELAEAGRVSDVLQALERQEEAAQSMARGAAATREALVAALSTGAATICASSGDEDD